MFKVIEKKYQQPYKHKTSYGIIFTTSEGLEHGTYVWDRIPSGFTILAMKEALMKSSRNNKRGCFYLDENLPYKNREINVNPNS